MKKLLASLFALVISLSLQAKAAVLWMGGEDIDYTSFTGGTWNSNNVRSNWSRRAAGIQSILGGMTNVPPSRVAITSTFTAGSTVWVSVQFSFGSGCISSLTTAGHNTMGLASPDGVWRILIQGNGSNDSSYRARKRSSAGVETNLANSSVNDWPVCDGLLHSIIVKVVYAVSGSVDVYIDGSMTPSLTYSGDTTTDSATELNQLFLGGPGTATNYWNEVIVADEDPRGWGGLLTLYPAANGNTQEWGVSTGSTPCANNSFLGALEANSANYVFTPGENLKMQCALGSKSNPLNTTVTLPSGTWSVKAVGMKFGIVKGSAGPQKFRFSTRSGGVDYSSTDQVVDISHFWRVSPLYIQSQHPALRSWQPGDLTSPLNFGVESAR